MVDRTLATAVSDPSLIGLLKATRTYGNIDAPVLAWGAAGIVVAWLLVALVMLAWHWVRIFRRTRSLSGALRQIADQLNRRPGHGASLGDIEKVRKVLGATRGPIAGCWSQFERELVEDRSEDTPTWFAEQSFGEAVAGSDLTSEFNADFYRSTPGILTGIGLCATFMAILIALLDVRLDGTRVVGLEMLIGGLSGKFLSSIAALLAATILIVVEKNVFHSFERLRRGLVHEVDRIFPRLTVGQVLMKIQREMAEQTLSFRLFNTDLATKLKDGVSEGVRPTMERMVESIEQLNELIAREQATKNDSMAEQIEGVLTKLQTSMERTLSDMGQSFSSSLSGSTMHQFEQLAESLAGATHVIQSMNEQSQGTHSALRDVVSFARKSTEEQLALGQSQVEELTAVLRELMHQMNESANTSVGQMSSTLTAVVHDLSTKVGDLSSHLASTVADASGKATTAASNVVAEVSRWSEKNERQLAELMERHAIQLDRVEALGSSLAQATARFTTTMHESARFIDDLKLLSSNSATAVKAVERASGDIRDVQNGFLEAALSVSTHTEHLTNVTRSHENAWGQMKDTLAAYESAFQRAQKASGELLTQINTGAAHFSNITKEHFESLMKYSDVTLADAVKKMESITNELSEVIEEVSEALTPLRKSTPPPPAATGANYVRR